jgi:hypothetical protein
MKAKELAYQGEMTKARELLTEAIEHAKIL